MPSDSPIRRDAIRVLGDHEDNLKDIRRRRKGGTRTKTILIGGPDVTLDSSVYIPPFYVSLDYDGDTPEWKMLHAFRGEVSTGTLTLDWHLNGLAVATGHILTSTPIEKTLDTPIELADGDRIRPVITAGSAPDLSASAVMIAVSG